MSSNILFAFDLQLVIASNCCDDLSPREWEPLQEQFATDESPTVAAFIDQRFFKSFTSFIEMQLRKEHLMDTPAMTVVEFYQQSDSN